MLGCSTSVQGFICWGNANSEVDRLWLCHFYCWPAALCTPQLLGCLWGTSVEQMQGPSECWGHFPQKMGVLPVTNVGLGSAVGGAPETQLTLCRYGEVTCTVHHTLIHPTTTAGKTCNVRNDQSSAAGWLVEVSLVGLGGQINSSDTDRHLVAQCMQTVGQWLTAGTANHSECIVWKMLPARW